MNSFLDSGTLREREREGERGGEREGVGGIESKMGSPCKVQSSPKVRANLALRDGQVFGIRPLFGAGAKGVERGVKGRQIWRPLHSDYVLLRSLNLSEMDA